MSYPPPGFHYWPPPDPYEPPEPEPPGRPRSMVIGLIVIGVILAVLAVAGALGIVFSGGIGTAPTVPSTPPASEPAPTDTVQAPPVTPPVTPSVSAPASQPVQPSGQQPVSPQSLALPDVRSMSGEAARAALVTAGFRDVVMKSDSGRPVSPEHQWTVYGQTPASPAVAAPEQQVVLMVTRIPQSGAPPAGASPRSPSATPSKPPVSDGPGTDPRYATCEEANAAGLGGYRRGSPGYAWYLDRDGDGVTCETD